MWAPENLLLRLVTRDYLNKLEWELNESFFVCQDQISPNYTKL